MLNNPLIYLDPNGFAEVYFLYTYKTNSKDDQRYYKWERASINDDVKYLKSKGITVEVNEGAVKSDIEKAFYDKDAKLIVTSGHGFQTGGIETADGGKFLPKDIDKTKVSTNLNTVVFENCYQGDHEQEWEKSLDNKVDVVGWKGETNTTESKSFNGLGWWDRQKENLRDLIYDIFGRK